MSEIKNKLHGARIRRTVEIVTEDEKGNAVTKKVAKTFNIKTALPADHKDLAIERERTR